MTDLEELPIDPVKTLPVSSHGAPGGRAGNSPAVPAAGIGTSFVVPAPTQRYPWYVRILFALQRRHYGRELEPARLWGCTPRAFLAMALMYGALDRRRSPIETKLRSLVQVRVSQINWCDFCVDLNSATGLDRGVTYEQLSELDRFETSRWFTAREKAALAFAEEATRSDRRPDADHIARLRAHFDDRAIIELAALIAYQNMSSKFNAALGVAPQGFCRVRGAGEGT